MPSASITVRTTKTGRRFVVRYRLGGRTYPVEHGRSFRTLKEARARRDLITGDSPPDGIPPRRYRHSTPERKTVADVHETWLEAKRLKISDGTLVNFAAHWLRLEPTFGNRDPETITFLDVQAWISEQEGHPNPGGSAQLPRHASPGSPLRGCQPKPGERRAAEPTRTRRARNHTARGRTRSRLPGTSEARTPTPVCLHGTVRNASHRDM
jgi:hypothetical protein